MGNATKILFMLFSCSFYHSASTAGNCTIDSDCGGSGTYFVCQGQPGSCICISGYTGPNCNQSLCPSGCVSGQGSCTSPGVCTCNKDASNRLFWRGVACEIPICYPDCQNGGWCNSAGGSKCTCPGQLTGNDCSILSQFVYPGNSLFVTDGTNNWTTASLVKAFSVDADSLPYGFPMQPTAPEYCCPCGSFVQDGSCYFLINLPNAYFPYLENYRYPVYAHQACFAAGGQLATFEKGNSAQKMANFFKWLATDAGIQLAVKPVDSYDPQSGYGYQPYAAIIGACRDFSDNLFYWETNPPIPIATSLYVEGEPNWHGWGFLCALAHKSNPKLRECEYWTPYQAAICMIRNPCSQSPSCKPGKPDSAGATKMFDRCVTPGNIVDLGNAYGLTRKEATETCTAKGGFVSSIRLQYEMRYWAFSLYPYDSTQIAWDNQIWVGLNHFKSDYYWDAVNKNLASPLHVDWASNPAEPNDPYAGQCTLMSAAGWNDYNCTSTARFACRGGLVDGATLTTASKSTSTTTTPTTSTKEGCCPFNWARVVLPSSGQEICYWFNYEAKTWSEAQQICTRMGNLVGDGACLAVADTSEKMQKLFGLMDSFLNDSYWVALTKNAYGIWAWPNTLGQPLSAEIVGSSGLATGVGCEAVINKPSSMVQAVCPNATNPTLRFPFICEMPMGFNYCNVCQRPRDSAGLNAPDPIWDNWQELGGPLTMPLRVSPDKCIWIFTNTGTRQQNVDACAAAGLTSVKLYQAYESRLVKSALAYLNPQIAWTDLVMRNRTAFTWEGEASTYTRGISSFSVLDWQKPCVSVDNGFNLTTGNCEEKRATVCTVPPAASCADLCPFGFTAVAGTCFLVNTSYPVSDPFIARQRCLTNDGTFNLASPATELVMKGLLDHLKEINATPDSFYWIGLDNSVRIAGTVLGSADVDFSSFTPDPDDVWDMDNGETFTLNSYWATGEPVPGNKWAILHYTGSSLLLRTNVTNPSSISFICERPKPCLQCEKGWQFFNGHCYYTRSASYQMRVQRGFCDYYQAYLVSINSPIEQQFISLFAGSFGSHMWIGVYRSRSTQSPTNKANEDFYEWDEGGRLADTRFINWGVGEPNMLGGISASEIAGSIAPSTGRKWSDMNPDWGFNPTICEKPARIPTIQCPYMVASGVACGDNVISPEYTYTTSSFLVSGTISYPPESIVMANPWCPSYITAPAPHWINIDFGTTPLFVRAVATVGSTSDSSMVTSYTVQYIDSLTRTTFVDLFTHKSVSPMTKQTPIFFAGNGIPSLRNSQEICPRLRAYQVRISPKVWFVKPIMRLELKGCASTTANTPAFCECWVESFDNYGADSNNPHWKNTASADSSFDSNNTPDRAMFPDADFTWRPFSATPDAYGWAPNTVDGSNWWQVTFSVLKVVTGLAMKGREPNQFITSYYVQWSHTGYAYTFMDYYSLDGQPRLFVGPGAASMVTQQTFCPPMKTIALRIVPASYSGTRPALTVQIFACMARGRRCFDCCDEIGLCNCNCPVGWTGSACATVSSDRNYYIDAQPPVCESDELLQTIYNTYNVSASTGTALNGAYYWNGNGYVWTPSSGDTAPYWKVDFKRDMSISIVKVSGGANSWVSRYNLWFLVQNSENGLFYPILEEQSNPQSPIKAIPGAREAPYGSFVPYYLCPNIRTRSLVFRPLVMNGTGTEIEMRFQIHGCPPHASCSTCCTHDDGCQCKCPVGFATNYQSSSIQNPWDHCDQWNMMPIDCEDIAMRSPTLPSGVYPIYPPGGPSINVYCDMTSLGGGWTVIQSRIDNTQDFYKKWSEYRDGFGNLERNFWLGNENIYRLTSSVNTYQLLVKLTTADAQLGIYYYSNFYLENEAAGYKINFSSEACDSNTDSLGAHNGQKFATKDNDTDGFPCAANAYGGWWYIQGANSATTCHMSNLNGYFVGTTAGTMATWARWRGYMEPMKTMQMLIRRSPLPNVVQPFQPNYPQPVDCEDIQLANPGVGSGVYTIYPIGSGTPVSVFCEMVARGGGWTVIQRHYDGSVNFNRNWTDYETGFGTPSGNYWLGNSWINKLTTPNNNVAYRLAIVLEDSTGEKRTSFYEGMYLAAGAYGMVYVGYTTGGDNEAAGDSLWDGYGRGFQTPDQTWGQPCPAYYRTTGWWFGAWNAYGWWPNRRICSSANLNGNYGSTSYEGGIFWETWKGRYESLKSATMMIKRASGKPRDCQSLHNPSSSTYNTSNVYWIYPYGSSPIQVYCKFNNHDIYYSNWYYQTPPWTVIQRRYFGNADFKRTWDEYKQGFWGFSGTTANSDFWLGLEKIHNLVKSAPYQLRVQVLYSLANRYNCNCYWNGSTTICDTCYWYNSWYRYYDYSDFYISGEDDGYRLFVTDGQSGSAGDSLTNHNLMVFSTFDKPAANIQTCMANYGFGGWWYNPDTCDGSATSNLNANFNKTRSNGGIFWRTAWNSSNETAQIVLTEMMIKGKAAPYVFNLPFATTKQLCPALKILQHDCQHLYAPISGDTVRVMDPTTPGVYAGADLVCKPYAEPMDCGYYQSQLTGNARFMSQTRSDLSTQSTGTVTGYCDQETMGGGWNVLQRRIDDTQTFLQDITAYDLSFGSPSGNFWQGNIAIRGLTSTGKYELLVEMKTTLTYAFALYDVFYISSSVNVLHLESSYQSCSTAGDSLSKLEGKPFIYDTCGTGAWWYPQSAPCGSGTGSNSFPTSNLNAPFGPQSPPSKGIYWWTFQNGFSPNLMATSMKIRRQGTHGRYIMAANFTCDQGSNYTKAGVADYKECQDACTNYGGFTCVVAVFNRIDTCILRSATCNPPKGQIDTSVDSYFRMDTCNMLSSDCGPPPIMTGTSMKLTDLPNIMSVNYTCRDGFSNALWNEDWTILRCDNSSGRWIGQWLDCKTLCGDIPDLSSSNAVLSPNSVTEGGTIILFYECQEEYEWIYGNMTRTCAPPFDAWKGDEIFCNTTRCSMPPVVPNSQNSFTNCPSGCPVPVSKLNKRYAFWNYTCHAGYVFRQTMGKWRTIYCGEDKNWQPKNIGDCIPDCTPVGGCQNGTCIAPGVCDCAENCSNCTTPNCLPIGGCLNGGSCVAFNVCVCNPGWTGETCSKSIEANSLIQLDPLVLPKITNETELTPAVMDTINNLVTSTANSIVSNSNPATVVTSAIGFMSSAKDILKLFLTSVESFGIEQISNTASTFTASGDSVMAALTNSTLSEGAISDETDGKCKVSSGPIQGVYDQPTSVQTTYLKPTKRELEQLYGNFTELLNSLALILQRFLHEGQNLTYNGKFFSGLVLNLRLDQLPGLKLQTGLASVDFPMAGDPLNLLDNPPATLKADSKISVLMMAYLTNILDVNLPFNMPTVSIHVYLNRSEELSLNHSKPIVTSVRPVVSKALLFSSQKVEAQCDVSKITCDLTTNADILSSLVSFPIQPTAGDFVLIFPPEKMSFAAYILFNNTPSPIAFTWLIKIGDQGIDLTNRHKSSIAPRMNFVNRTAEFRLIIPEAAFPDGPVRLFVSMKRNLSQTGNTNGDLPPELCGLQPCYGYHLRIGPASKDKILNKILHRRKREVQNSTATSDDCGIELEPSSTESMVTFKSAYFGDFGADLVILPNTIQFSDIFASFTTLVANNYAVLAFVVATIVSFLISVVLTAHWDKLDLKEWAYLPLKSSNLPDHNYKYLVSLSYYNVRRIKLKPKIYIRILGNAHGTKWRLLDDGVRNNNFDGKRPANFMLTTFVPFGKLESIELVVGSRLQEKPREKPFELYMDKVIVIDLANGNKYVFLVKRTMHSGQNEPVELAKEDDIKGFRYLISSHSRVGISDLHPWLSILNRPLPSNWTRSERLGCVVSTIFMAMLVNAMFYGQEASAPRVGIQIGGFFRISWFTFWTSLVGSIIVIPPTALIGFIFKRIRRFSAERSEWQTIFKLKIHATEESEKKKPFQLPWFCVFFGWLLVAACVGVSAFIVFSYSLAWGREKSLQWLSVMIMHIVQDILIIQSVKVFLISGFSSTLLNLPDDGLNVGKAVYAKGTGKPKTELFKKFRNMIAAIFHHIIYVIAFALVIGTTQNQHAFKQVKDLRPIVSPNISTSAVITDHSWIFQWLDKRLLPNLLNGNQLEYGGLFRRKNIYYVLNHDVVLMGPIRLRQQRYSTTSCPLTTAFDPGSVSKFLSGLGANKTVCQNQYETFMGLGSDDGQEKGMFDLSWKKKAPYVVANNLTSDQMPWTYRETDGPPYIGWQATYKTGGYYVDLPKELSKARALLTNLTQNRWLDNATSVLFVDFVLYNAQLNLFSTVKIVFEALGTGGMAYHSRIYPLSLYQYSGANALVTIVVQAFWIFILLTHLFKIGRQIAKFGMVKFQRDGWNFLDLFQILLSLGIVGLFATRIYVITRTVSRFQTDRTTFVNLDLLANWEELMFNLYGIAFFLTMLLFFRHLTANKFWALLVGTLSKGKADIFVFIIVFFIVTISFAMLGHLSFGITCTEFRNFTESIMTLIQNIIGVTGSLMKLSLNSRFILAFCFAYSTLVMFMAVQVFMTIISVTYGLVSNDIEGSTNWDADLSRYMTEEWNKLTLLVSNIDAKREERLSAGKPQKRNETVADKVERLVKLVNQQERELAEEEAWHRLYVQAWQADIGRFKRLVPVNSRATNFGVNYGRIQNIPRVQGPYAYFNRKMKVCKKEYGFNDDSNVYSGSLNAANTYN